jgi:uncharacterized protein YneF (UPF0154 family)
MHTILGLPEKFASDYRTSRLPIISIFFKQASSATKTLHITAITPILLANIIGFFLLENIFQQCAIQKTGPFNNNELTILWDQFGSKLEVFLIKFIPLFKTPEEVLLVKEDLLLFVESTNDVFFNFKDPKDPLSLSSNDNKVLSCLSVLWTRFEEVQVSAVIERCRECLENSHYQPLYVETEIQFLSQIRAFNIEDLQMDDAKGKSQG